LTGLDNDPGTAICYATGNRGAGACPGKEKEDIMQIRTILLAVAAAGTLAACETAPNGQRVLTADARNAAIGGAGLGAAAALTDNDVGTAVAIGAAGGALFNDATGRGF
jgi:hypothetical protein